MEIRAYTAADAQATATVFLRAVRETAPVHYSPRQVADWAADYRDLGSWASARASAHARVAVVDGRVVGFTEVDDEGYVHMLFVDPDVGRQGIGSALLASVLGHSATHGLTTLTAYASLTSRPVFERHGFVVTGEKYYGEGDGAALTYAMRRVLSDPGPDSGASTPDNSTP